MNSIRNTNRGKLKMAEIDIKKVTSRLEQGDTSILPALLNSKDHLSLTDPNSPGYKILDQIKAQNVADIAEAKSHGKNVPEVTIQYAKPGNPCLGAFASVQIIKPREHWYSSFPNVSILYQQGDAGL